MTQSDRRSFRDMTWNLFATYGSAWLWVCFFLFLINAVAGARVVGSIPILSVTLHWLSFFSPVDAYLRTSPGAVLLLTLVFAPVFEEALFRMLPLTLVKGKSADKVHAVQIAVCAIAFGYMHGSPMNIPIQGFVGYMLGRLYVRNANSQFSSYISCVFVHAAYNFTVLAASVFRG
jgi:membrane protease YdiL (CAAX protease family)